jgi:hypothetical protein
MMRAHPESVAAPHPHVPAAMQHGFAIRGATAGGGDNILNADAKLIRHVELLPRWPLVLQTGLNGGGCCYSGIVGAIFVIDTAKVAGYTLGSIAEYVSMLALSMVESPDHCDPLPSIQDLMAPSCGARDPPGLRPAIWHSCKRSIITTPAWAGLFQETKSSTI